MPRTKVYNRNGKDITPTPILLNCATFATNQAETNITIKIKYLP